VRRFGFLATALSLVACQSSRAGRNAAAEGGADAEIVPIRAASCSLEAAIRFLESSADGGTGSTSDDGESACDIASDGSSNSIFLPHQVSDAGAVTVYKIAGPQKISTNITIIGDGDDQVLIEGTSASSVFNVLPGGSLTLQSLTAREVSGRGRIIENHGYLQLRTVTLENSGSDALEGGAIFNGGSAEIFDATFRHNRADSGGALFNGSGSNLDIFWSTFWDNSAVNGGAICNGLLDQNGNLLDAGGPIRIHSSTITQNIARGTQGDPSTGNGGGFFAITYLDIHYCTVVFNEAVVAGGVYAFNDSETRTNGSIVASNIGVNPDYFGDPHGEGLDDAPCLFSNEAGINHVPGHVVGDNFQGNPRFVDDLGKSNLHGLTRNPGPNHSWTHAIDHTSDAYAKIPCPSADPGDNFYWDQRHLPRPIGNRLCDQGAYAFQGP
jgi:hypothetical protein